MWAVFRFMSQSPRKRPKKWAMIISGTFRFQIQLVNVRFVVPELAPFVVSSEVFTTVKDEIKTTISAYQSAKDVL